MVCIIKSDIEKAKNALKQEGLSITQLHKKYNTTESRIDFLTKQFGDKEEAVFFNNKYEKLLLKRQKDKLRDWVKKAEKQGINTSTTKTLFEKIESLKEVLQRGKKSKDILNGLVKQKLGFGITQEEVKKILDANNNLVATKRAILKKYKDYATWTDKKGTEKFKQALDAEFDMLEKSGVNATDKFKADAEFKQNAETPLLDYAAASIVMKRIYDDAKIRADKAKRRETGIGKITDTASTIAGNIKSLKATFDISGGRQLSAAFLTDFGSATKAWIDGIKAFGKALGNKKSAQASIDMMEALLYVRPNHFNGNYRKLGVAVGIREEAFPEGWASKYLFETFKGGNVLFASDAAYNIMLQTARANITDNLIELANGDIGGLKNMGAGDYVNLVTGRGKIPVNNPDTERFINTMLFSPRWLSSRITILLDSKLLVKGLFKELNLIEKQRAKASFGQIMYLTLLPMLIKGIVRAGTDDDDIYGEQTWEKILSAFDARSSDFGKIVWGDTRFDTTFGTAGIVVAATRWITQQQVSVSGTVRDVKWYEVLGKFFEGKASPAVRTTVDFLNLLINGEDAKNFMYQPITWGGLALQTIAPITIENIIELYSTETENEVAAIVGVLLDFVGVSSNTYGIDERSAGKSEELKTEESRLARRINRNPASLEPASTSSIKKKLSGKQQERAVEEFKKLYNKEATKLIKSSKYKTMSDEEKSEALAKVRQKVNTEIKRKYGIR